MVFAGYADDMDLFMQANSGLYRRIGYTFDFSDYSPRELSEILNSIVRGPVQGKVKFAGLFFCSTGS